MSSSSVINAIFRTFSGLFGIKRVPGSSRFSYSRCTFGTYSYGKGSSYCHCCCFCVRRESNPYLEFRKLLFYPLNYEAKTNQPSNSQGLETHYFPPAGGRYPLNYEASRYLPKGTIPWQACKDREFSRLDQSRQNLTSTPLIPPPGHRSSSCLRRPAASGSWGRSGNVFSRPARTASGAEPLHSPFSGPK